MIDRAPSLAQVVVVAHANQHQVRAPGRQCRRFRLLALVFADPLGGAFRRAVVDRDGVAGVGEMAGHRIAHIAQADKGCVDHGVTPAGR
jgi:hypothetical protein